MNKNPGCELCPDDDARFEPEIGAWLCNYCREDIEAAAWQESEEQQEPDHGEEWSLR